MKCPKHTTGGGPCYCGNTETAGEPKRYSCTVNEFDFPKMEEDRDGEWRHQSDYATVERENAALQSRIDAMQAHCDRLTGMRFSERMHAALVSRAETAEKENAELREKLAEAHALLDRHSDAREYDHQYIDTLRAQLAQARDEALMARDTLIQLLVASSELTRIAFDSTPITDPECMRVWMQWEAAQKASTDLIVASVQSPKSAEGEPG